MTDDVWDESAREEIGRDTQQHLSHLFQDGFRAGVAEGQEEKSQEGFDEGYKQGMKEGLQWGQHCGNLAMQEALLSKGEAPTVTPEVEEAVKLLKGVDAADVFVSVHNRLAAVLEAELRASDERSVLPKRIEGAKGDTEEKMRRIQQALSLAESRESSQKSPVPSTSSS